MYLNTFKNLITYVNLSINNCIHYKAIDLQMLAWMFFVVHLVNNYKLSAVNNNG